MSAQPVSPDPDHDICDTQHTYVGSGDPSSAPAATKEGTTPTRAASRRDADLLVMQWADELDRAEKEQTARRNQLRSFLSDDEYGAGLDPNMESMVVLKDQFARSSTRVEEATDRLEKAMEAHYLAEWQQSTKGVGAKTLGRLIAEIGDPSTRDTVGQLFAYCGIAGPGQQSRGGWNKDAGKRLHNVLDAVMKWAVRELPHCDDSEGYDIGGRKPISPYGQVYLDARTQYQDAVHNHPCSRCSPKGADPAPIGSPVSRPHQNGMARRKVKREIVRDLYEASQPPPAMTGSTPMRQTPGGDTGGGGAST